MKKLVLLTLSLCVMQFTFGQLTGIKTIPGDYPTIEAAVAALNSVGVGSGGVTFNVAAGHTETITAVISLTATGTVANPVIFQKSGAGANPLITANAGANTPASAVQDGIWNLVGSDYVTIDGIDLYDPNAANPATMEYGYALFKAAVDNGCQYNTIKNCVVTLNRTNNASGSGPSAEGSKAINVINATVAAQTTTLTPTVPEGTNSYNMFYSNTLQNCNYGIVLYGYAATTPFTLGDTGNDVGGSAPATGNSILNYGGAASATNPAAAVRATNQWGVNISYNIINNNNGSGVNHASTLRGIYAQSGVSANVTISNNTLTLNGGMTTSQVSVIENGIGATAASNTININNNLITNCTNTTTTTGAWYGIYNNGASATNLNIQNNTFSNNSTSATSGATYLIQNSGACPGVVNITGNQLSHAWNGAAAYTGTTYSLYNSSGTTATTLNITGNNFSAYNHTLIGTGTIYYVYNSFGVGNLNISDNTWTNLTLNHSGIEYLNYVSGSTQVSLNFNNNSIVTGFTRTAASGSLYLYYCGTSALGTSTQTISGNNFSNISSPTAGSGSFYMIYNSDGSASPYPKKSIFNNTYSNNNVNTTGTTYGIYTSYLGDGTMSSETNIYNNTLSDITVSGTLYCLYPGGTVSPTYKPNVYGNTISNITTNGAASVIYGAYLAGGGAGLNFYNNKISTVTANGATGAAHGVYVTSAVNTTIYNNLVADINAPNSSLTAPAPSVTGMYFGGGTTINAYYNTVYINAVGVGANFGSAGIYASSTPTVTLSNNIFVNSSTPNGAGKAIAYQRSSSTLTTYGANSNYNDFYAGIPGPNNLIFFDVTNSHQTLANYKLYVMPRDAFSVTESPAFLSLSGASPNFLHIDASVATQLESGAANVTGIVDDYDGNIRQGNTGYSGTGVAPDIGADEFEGIPLDVTPPAIIYTPLINVSVPGERTLTASIFDASGVPTAGIGLPVLYWRINAGAWTPVTGTYVSGSTYTFTFGAGAVIGDVVYYYIAAQDMAPAPNTGTYPSTGAGGFTINPPAAATPPTPPSSYSINTPLSGTYTVGLALFNNVTGSNITFKKSVTTVMKEVDVEVSVKSSGTDEPTETAVIPASKKEIVPVEEITWIPMENGLPYTGGLFADNVQVPGFEGRETVSGVYATITAAIADLNTRGVSGPVTFLLTDATYPTETFPLIVSIYNDNKPTATNFVTIKPSTGVTTLVSGASPSGQIFKILESHFVIDGSNSGGSDRNLTLENTSTTTPQVVVVGSTGTTPITNVTVKNSNIINGITSSSALIVSDGTAPGSAGYYSNITIQNNTIQKAYIGAYCNAVVAAGNGNGLVLTQNDLSFGGTNTIRLVGLYVQGVDGATLSNNILGNMANTTDGSNVNAIWFATGTINSSILNNSISTMSGTSMGPRGIAASTGNTTSNLTISGNTISTITTSASSPPYGIYIYSSTGIVSITRNQVNGLLNTNTGGYGARAINFIPAIASSNSLIANNVIYDIVCTGDASSTYFGLGIAIDGATGGVVVYHNSVNLYGSYAGYSAATITAAFYNSSTATNLDVRDNIFVNSFDNTTVTTDKAYAIYSAAANTAFTDINFNDYFANGPTIILGYLGSDRITLTDWQTATGKDANSKSVDPLFVSASDLHPASTDLDNQGIYLPVVTVDFAGITRTNPPDIGAFEFGINPTLLTLDASGIYCAGGTLNGTINANGLSVDSFFDYGPTTSYGTSVAGTPANITGTTPTPVSTVISMPPSTTWHFRLRGVTSAGLTVYGNDLTITSEGPGAAQALTLPATFIASYTATLNGSVYAACNSTTVTFEYGLTDSYGSTITADQSPVSGSTWEAVSAPVGGLEINTVYHYRVVASNSEGTVYGADQVFETGAAPPDVITYPASNIGNFSARLNGSADANNQNSTITFEYGLNTSYGSIVSAVPGIVTGDVPTVVYADIAGLAYNTTYHFRIVGQNPAGTNYGSDQFFTTLCPVPDAAGVIAGPVSVCQATAGHVYTVPPITYAYAGYVWTLPAGGTITAGAGTNSITVSYSSSAVSGDVSVYGTSICGNGAASTLPVTVNPLPVPVISGPIVACITNTYTYNTAAGMSGYTWTVSSGGQIMSGAGTNAITVKWNSAGSQSVSVTYTSTFGCPAASPTTLNVAVGNLTSPTIAGSDLMCVNSGWHVYTTQQGFSNYVWTVTSGGTIISGQGTYQVEVDWTVAGAQSVSVNYANTYGCSASTPTSFGVTVMGLPGNASPISGTSELCAGTMGVTYSVNPIPNTVDYIWTLPAGATIVDGENTSIITVDFALDAVAGDIRVQGENLCGTGNMSPPYFVAVNPVPETPVASVDEFFMLHSSAPAGNQWYFNGTMIDGATGQDYQAEEEGFYWTVVTLEGCGSEESNHVEVIFVGLNEPDGSGFSIHPVPNNGKFVVSVNIPGEHVFTISVYNDLGVMMYEQSDIMVKDNVQHSIDLNKPSTGIYTVVFQGNDQTVVKKILVTK